MHSAQGSEKRLGIPRQLQEPDPLLDADPVCLHVPLDPGPNLNPAPLATLKGCGAEA
jgi:hypothetical protein